MSLLAVVGVFTLVLAANAGGLVDIQLQAKHQPKLHSFSTTPFGLSHSLSCSLSTSMFQDQQQTNTQSLPPCTSLFFHPNLAHCIIAVPALDAQLAEELNLDILKPQVQMDLPMGDSLKLLNEWLGSSEIPARTFRVQDSSIVDAYAEHPLSHRMADNLVDKFASAYEHATPMIVSVSSNRAETLSFADRKGSTTPMFLQDRSFGPSNSQFHATEKELINMLQDELLDKEFHRKYNGNIDVQDSTIFIEKDDSKFKFDLNKETDFKYFAEIAYALMFPNKILSTNQEAIEDEIPDLYSFVFSGLEGIADSYGRDSKELRAAACLLDTALDVLLKQMKNLYNGRLGTDFAGFVSPRAAYPELASKAADILRDDDVAAFPTFTVPTTDKIDIQEACNHFSEKFQEHASVKCNLFPSSKFHTLSMFEVMQVANESNGTGTNGTSVSTTDIGRFQIPLWLSIILIFITYYAIYGVLYMDVKKDTLLNTRFSR